MRVQNSTLAAVATALETAVGASTSANTTEEGYWKRIAAALETGSGTSSSANDNLAGYMTRAAAAAEVLWGGSGSEENAEYDGLLKRIVDAMELSVGVADGSLGYRLGTAGVSIAFSVDEAATFGALTLAGAGGYPVQSGAAAITDADSTNLAISGGYLAPATAGVAAGTVVYSNGGTVEVGAEANTYSVRSVAEIASVFALGRATYGTKFLLPQEGYEQKGFFPGSSGQVIYGGVTSSDLNGSDWTIYLDFQFNGDTNDQFLLSNDIGRAIRVRMGNRRVCVADTTAWQDSTNQFTAGRLRVVITHVFATSKLNMWVQPVGGSVSLEVNDVTKTFNGTRSMGCNLGYLATGRVDVVSLAAEALIYDAAIYAAAVSNATRDALLAGGDPQDYATGLIYHPALGEPKVYNRQFPAREMVAQHGALTANLITNAHTNNATGPNKFVILRDPDTGAPVQYNKGGGLKYWGICETGTKENVELLSSNDMTTWAYDSTIFTATGLGETDAYPSDFLYMGNISGGHAPFSIWLATQTGTDVVIRHYTSSNLSAWSADADNPVFTHKVSGSNGPEDFRITRTDAGTWFAVFEANDLEGNGAVAIGSATNANAVPSGDWTLASAQLFDDVDAPFDTVAGFIANPSIIKRNGVYYVFYEALLSGSDVRTCLRTSTDLVTWTEWGSQNVTGWFINCPVYFGGQILLYLTDATGNTVARVPFDPKKCRFGPDIPLLQ